MAAALFKLPDPEDEADEETAAVELGITYVADIVADKVDDPIERIRLGHDN